MGKPYSRLQTLITLIPKTPAIADMGDFRPISCVNHMYKLMTKIMVDKVSKDVGELISPFQTTFIQGKNISNNTMLAEEMIFGFSRKRTPKKCCISI